MNMRMYLVKRRYELNLSMRKTAELSGFDYHHYNRIETGQIKRIGFITLCRIAKVLKIDFNYLFNEEVAYLSRINHEDITQR